MVGLGVQPVRRTWDEIVELILRLVFQVAIAREILRRAGFWPPTAGLGVPPGGKRGEWLVKGDGYEEDGTFVHYGVDTYHWQGPLERTFDLRQEDYDPTVTAPKQFNTGPRPVISFHEFRNITAEAPDFNRGGHPDYEFENAWSRVVMQPPNWPDTPDPEYPPYNGPETYTDDWIFTPSANGTSGGGGTPIYYFAHHHHQPAPPTKPYARHDVHQYFVWESIPAGDWYYPLNVDWFVKQVDLGAGARLGCPIQINVQACVAEGNPSAELLVKYSTASRSGPWTTLASCDLSPGGLVRSEWQNIPEEAQGDVWLSLFLRAHGGVSRLHMVYAEARVRWDPPEDYWRTAGTLDWTL